MGKQSIQGILADARRNQLLDAATEVFASKGFHRATIRDIAATAGVADGTIYNYFRSKEELLLGILDRVNESSERRQHFAEGAEEEVGHFFHRYLQHRLGALWANHEAIQALLPELLTNDTLRMEYITRILAPTFALGEQFFERLAEGGHIRSLPVPLLTRALAATVLGLAVLRLLGDEKVSEGWNDLPDLLTILYMEGLSGEGGETSRAGSSSDD